MKRLPRFDDVKTAEAAAVLLNKSNNSMEYFRLLKLLYIADKEALKRWERPISFDSYVSMKYGQVLSNTYDLIKRERKSDSGVWEETVTRISKYDVELKNMPRIKKLTRAEVELLEETVEKYRGVHWEDLGNMTKTSEYQKPTGFKKSIPTPFEKVLEALEYDNEDINRIKSGLEDYSSIQELSEI